MSWMFTNSPPPPSCSPLIICCSNFSIPYTDFSRHPARLAQSAAKGHQGVVDNCSLPFKKERIQPGYHMRDKTPPLLIRKRVAVRFPNSFKQRTVPENFFQKSKLLPRQLGFVRCDKIKPSSSPASNRTPSLKHTKSWPCYSPEYHKWASCEFWWLPCLLANIPSSSFLHT